eukprot:symbB.v1.2.040424.t2/scaffold7221.1/size14631/1
MAPYSADYPKVIIHPTDTCKFRLELCDEQDKIFHFVALSRTMRDLITLLVRTFHARQYVATSFVLSRLFQDPARPGAPLTTIMTQDFDLQKLAERLGKELDRTVGQLESAFQTKIAELTHFHRGPNLTSHHPMPSRRDAAHQQPSHRYRSPSRSRSPVARRTGGYLWHWELTRSVTTLADAFLDQETHPETLEGMWAEAADLRNRFIQHMEDRKVKHEGYSDPKGRNQEQIEANSQPSVVNWIGKLQELCQKRAARPLEKHEVCFTTETLSTHPNVFQSVVRRVSPIL